MLLQSSSLGIQIKSKEETILATNKIEYLTKLELPFFVGVIDRENLRLTSTPVKNTSLSSSLNMEFRKKELKLSPVRDVVGIKDYCQTKTDESLEVHRRHLL